jgi:hypothetical protein
VNNDKQTINTELENAAKEPSEKNQENSADESEFKLTVRKLEMPVRPRGVLAE